MVLVSITCMRNQAKNAKRIAEGYIACSVKPDLCVFVMDRSTDQTKHVLETTLSGSDVRYVILDAVWQDTLFAAGRPRDWAVDQVRSYLLPSVNCFVFLDGDCIPSVDLFKEHDRIHSFVYPYPCLVNGTRVDEQVCGTLEQDSRLESKNIFATGIDTVATSAVNLYVDETTMVPACWGCHVSLNTAALDTAREINRIVLGDVNRTFASCFDGRWGGEDPFLAATLFRVNCLIVNANPSRSHVLHTWHDGSHRTNEHARILQGALNRFRRVLESKQVRFNSTVITNGKLVPSSFASVVFEVLHGVDVNVAMYLLSSVVCMQTKQDMDVLIALRKASATAASIPAINLDSVKNINAQPYARFRENIGSCDWCYQVHYQIGNLT